LLPLIESVNQEKILRPRTRLESLIRNTQKTK
jgi:hypothetical protein